ncbi:MAG: 2-thiouracil desulfurase family protein [Candidatus Izemoplasmatales bacterium]
MEKIGVSACLLGVGCKYNGKHNLNIDLIRALKGKELVLICPEVMGGTIYSENS